MADGVISSTVTEFKLHPLLIVGGVVALVVVFAVASKSKGAATPQQFSFSYGPSDAQLADNTALAIAQNNNQTQAGIASQYFQYLTAAGANTVSVANVLAQTQQFQTSDQDATAVKLAGIQANTQSQAISAQTTQAQIAAGTTQQGQALAAQTAQAATAAQLALGQYQADAQVQTVALNTAAANQQAQLAAQTAQAAYSTQAYIAATNDQTTQYVTAQNNATSNYQAALANQLANKQADYANDQAAVTIANNYQLATTAQYDQFALANAQLYGQYR